MNGLPTILVLLALRVFLPVLALLAIGTFVDRRRSEGNVRG
jgi:hypothetical protein